VPYGIETSGKGCGAVMQLDKSTVITNKSEASSLFHNFLFMSNDLGNRAVRFLRRILLTHLSDDDY
jgi:hypothetical protein